MLPVVTNVGLEIPFLFTGAIVTETIFVWPGMGRLFIDARWATRLLRADGADHDHLGRSILFANLMADVVYAIVDPRIRYD